MAAENLYYSYTIVGDIMPHLRFWLNLTYGSGFVIFGATFIAVIGVV